MTFPSDTSLTEKPIFKPFTNKKLLSKLPFSKCFPGESKITKNSKAFKNYAQCYTVKVLDFRDLAMQIYITNTHVKIN